VNRMGSTLLMRKGSMMVFIEVLRRNRLWNLLEEDTPAGSLMQRGRAASY
jgi:hypothetical protein